MMFLFYAINIVLTTLCRFMIRSLLQLFRKKGYNLKYILLIGYSRAAEEYITRINANPQWGYVIRGILDDRIPSGTMYKGVKVVGRIENIHYILPENKLDEIAITLALKDYDHLEYIVDLCEKSGVHTKFIPDYNSLVPSHPYTEDLMGLPVINIRYVPLTNTINWVAKRTVDITRCLIIVLSYYQYLELVCKKSCGYHRFHPWNHSFFPDYDRGGNRGEMFRGRSCDLQAGESGTSQ